MHATPVDPEAGAPLASLLADPRMLDVVPLPPAARFMLSLASPAFAAPEPADIVAHRNSVRRGVRGVASAAVASFDEPLLAWLASRGADLWSVAGAAGSTRVLDWLARRPTPAQRAPPWTSSFEAAYESAFSAAIEAGQVAALDWVLTRLKRVPGLYQRRRMEHAAFEAASRGHGAAVDWVVANCHADAEARLQYLTCTGAMNGGHFALFERFFRMEASVLLGAIARAAHTGDVRFLDLCRARGLELTDPGLIRLYTAPDEYAWAAQLRDWFRVNYPAAYAEFLAAEP